MRSDRIQLSAVGLAVGCLFAAGAARAQEEDAKTYTQPTSTVEIGGLYVDKSSAKFGEYSGLAKSGGYGKLSFDLRGGDGYSKNESGGGLRWALQGVDLGLSSRELSGKVDQAGAWSLGFRYSELKHNLSDTYQTPYLGGNGGSVFTLPGDFGIATTTGTGTTVLTPAQQSAFHNLDVSSTRKNLGLHAATEITKGLDVAFDLDQLEQTGAKLMGFGQSNTAATGLAKPTGEAVVVLPMPTHYRTVAATLALHWTGEHGYASLAYRLSSFRDSNDRVGFTPSMAAVATGVDTSLQYMTTAPGNDMSQLSLTGGWKFLPTTKLAGSLSTSRNTQDAAYVDPGLQSSATGGLMISAMPATSLGGKVVNTHGDLKLTDQSWKNLSLAAAIKYDERENQTPSNIYNFDAIGSGHVAAYPNTPLSTRREAAEVSADYRVVAGQVLRVVVGHEKTHRWCASYGVNANYPAGTQCVVATDAREDKAEGSWRVRLDEGLDLKVGYVYADRKTDSDPLAVAAFIGVNGFVPPATSTTVTGQNAGDFYGFHPYFDATRREQVLKGGINWQPSDALSASLSSKVADDRYGTDWGVRKGKAWSVNLDTTYAFSAKGSVFAYLTQQHRSREMDNVYRNGTAAPASGTALNIPAFATWTNVLKDDDTTVGAGVRQDGLLRGKVDLSADASYSLGRTGYSTTLDYSAATTGGVTCDGTNASGAVVIGSCGGPPKIRNEWLRLKLAGSYNLDKASRVRLELAHQRLHAADYYYNGYQYGSTPSSLLPTNQQVPAYHVNAVGLSYLYSFQ